MGIKIREAYFVAQSTSLELTVQDRCVVKIHVGQTGIRHDLALPYQIAALFSLPVTLVFGEDSGSSIHVHGEWGSVSVETYHLG